MVGSYAAIRDLHAERRAFYARCGIALIIAALIFGALLMRLVDLQIDQHAALSTKSNDNRMRVTAVPPVRGLIYDRNGAVLAENQPSFVLEIVPEQVPDLDDTLERLGRLISISERDLSQFRRRLAGTPRFRGVVLRSQLSLEEMAAYEVNRHDFPGVDVKAGLTRHYPAGEATAHVIGYVGGITEAELAQVDERAYRGTTQIGKTGIEKSQEALLHGSTGARIVEANAAGRPLRVLEYQPGEPGHDLYLGLDLKLQMAAEAALEDREGAVVAIDPSNGEVLALVSRPSFDPQQFVDGIDHESFRRVNQDPRRPLFNRATQGQYPPGSTIKPLVALAGLDAGLIDTRWQQTCPGYFQLPNSERLYRDWKRRGHGAVRLRRAIAESCDIYFYQLSMELGIDRIHALLGQFGLGAPTGIDLPGEARGILPSEAWKRRTQNKPWYPGETVIAGIGQGYMNTTPLQLAHATARLAARGGGYVPHLVHAVSSPASGERRTITPVALPKIELSDPGHWDAVIDAMLAVTSDPHGTAARHMADAAYSVAGKTGTAQVAGLSQEDKDPPNIDQVPKRLRDHALFVAFAPVEAPSIALAVVVEHGGSGGGVAAPVARRILDAWLSPAATDGRTAP